MATLPTTNISITSVRNITGCPSTDLGTLCAKAVEGGKSGWAFNIAEAGGTIYDGYLLSNAAPYWNMWSDNSAGEWDVPLNNGVINTGSNIAFRLKRDANNRYMFSLGSFRGYDSLAESPLVPSVAMEYYRSGSSITVNLNLKGNFGSYNFKKIQGVSKCRVRLYEGSTVIASSTLVEYSNSSHLIFPVSFVMASTSTYSRKYTSKLILCNSLGDDIGEIPIDGEIKITISNAPKKYVGTVYVDNYTKIFRIDDDSLFNDSSFTASYMPMTGVNVTGRELKKMVYEKVNNATGAVISTAEITSFNLKESPKFLDSYRQGDKEVFGFDNTRLYNDSSGTYIKVSWYY